MAGRKNADDSHQHATDGRHQNCRMNPPVHRLKIPGAIRPGNHNASADAQPHKDVDDQIDQ